MKLFLAENKFDKLSDTIGRRAAGSMVKVVAVQRDEPHDISDKVYGNRNRRDPFDLLTIDQMENRAKYDVVVAIGNVSFTVSLQEFINLHDAFRDELSKIIDNV